MYSLEYGCCLRDRKSKWYHQTMATSIDYRTYCIDSSNQAVSINLSQSLCQIFDPDSGESGTGSGFPISKYLIDRPGNEQQSAEPRDVGAPDNGREVATGNDARTSGHARMRKLRGRLRQLMRRLESLLCDFKVAVILLSWTIIIRVKISSLDAVLLSVVSSRECGTPCTPPLIVVVGHYAQSAAVGVAGV